MKTKARALVLSGYGLNCEVETRAAFVSVGCHADVVHINDLIENPRLLKSYNILAFPGGFSYGDDTGSGRAYANKLRNHLSKELTAFVRRDTLTIGICNGFQILTQLGLLPGVLLHNEQARYIDRWVDVEVRNDSPWLRGISSLSLPIAHGEGRFYLDTKGMKELRLKKAIALQYVQGEIAEHFDLPHNPNGALEDVAGVTAYAGRVLGLMPHPERGVSFFQLPHWTYLKEGLLRNGKKLPKEGPGIALFKNAARYFA